MSRPPGQLPSATQAFLEELDLPQYRHLFVANGIIKASHLAALTDGRLESLVSLLAHALLAGICRFAHHRRFSLLDPVKLLSVHWPATPRGHNAARRDMFDGACLTLAATTSANLPCRAYSVATVD